MWVVDACLAALCGGAMSVLAKFGIRRTDSDAATAIRTVIVLLFSWLLVFLTGAWEGIFTLSANTIVFLVLSGLATGASWLCYFRALQLGEVGKVVPVDKSSTILTVLLAMIFFGETHFWLLKLLCVAGMGIGTYLMLPKMKVQESEKDGMRWLFYAVLSAVFAALTAIFGKIGVQNVDSNLATALRTIVVLGMAWGMVFVKHKKHLVRTVPKKELFFIILSGFATGGSWLFYYRALQNGLASVVVPIDKMSIVITITFSYFFLHEKLSLRALFGLLLVMAATIAMAVIG